MASVQTVVSDPVIVPRFMHIHNRSVVDRAIVHAVNRLGYRQPTDEQREIVNKFVKGRDVFVSLPTGSGKSLCYACLPLVFDSLRTASEERDHHSIVVVVAPLTALMQDQVASFRAKGLTAACVGGHHSGVTLPRVVTDEEVVARGKAQLVYMSPETLLSEPLWRELFRSPTYKSNLVALAIDEAHLVAKW